jgi:hypothetical protein
MSKWVPAHNVFLLFNRFIWGYDLVPFMTLIRFPILKGKGLAVSPIARYAALWSGVLRRYGVSRSSCNLEVLNAFLDGIKPTGVSNYCRRPMLVSLAPSTSRQYFRLRFTPSFNRHQYIYQSRLQRGSADFLNSKPTVTGRRVFFCLYFYSPVLSLFLLLPSVSPSIS